MKKLILSSIFLILSSLTITLSSCKKEILSEQNFNSIKESEAFLHHKYANKVYGYGNTLEMKYKPYRISEIIVSSQKTPIGYIVEDKNSNKLLYYVEIKVGENLLKTYDLRKNEINTFNLNTFIRKQKINSIDDFTFLNLIHPNSTTKRKFWGWSCGPCSSGFPDNFRTCCYYIFWTSNGCEQRSC